MTGLPKAQIPINAKRTDPGMYMTPEGVLYLDAAELLRAHGYEPTLRISTGSRGCAKNWGRRTGLRFSGVL